MLLMTLATWSAVAVKPGVNADVSEVSNEEVRSLRSMSKIGSMESMSRWTKHWRRPWTP